MNGKDLIEQSGIDTLIEDIQERMYEIPFENSAFQNLNFVVGAQLTPGRAYRAICLRLSAKLRALQECYFNLELEEIDIHELQEKIDNPETRKYDRMRAEVEMKKKLSGRQYTQKLVRDAIVEVETLYSELKKMPKYDAEMFEAEEALHFEQRLTRQLQGIQGARESLENMHIDRPQLQKKIQAVKQIETSFQAKLHQLAGSHEPLEHLNHFDPMVGSEPLQTIENTATLGI